MLSDGVEYKTSEYKYRKKLLVRVRVQVLLLKNVLEYEYRKKSSSPSTFTNLANEQFLSGNSSKFVEETAQRLILRVVLAVVYGFHLFPGCIGCSLLSKVHLVC